MNFAETHLVVERINLARFHLILKLIANRLELGDLVPSFGIFVEECVVLVITIVVLKETHQPFGKELKVDLHDFIVRVKDDSYELFPKDFNLLFECLLLDHPLFFILHLFHLVRMLIDNRENLLAVILEVQQHIVHDFEH